MILSLSACAPAEPKRYEASFLVLFDTVTTIVGYTNSEEDFTKAAQFIHDQLETYHQLYDIYSSYDGVVNIKTINENAGIAPVRVDQKIIDLLLEAKRMNDFTGGKINVAMGSVLSLWHTYREAGIDTPEAAELPPMAELQTAAAHTDLADVIIDEAASTVYFSDPALRLDVGAIAKGYATQRACDAAKAQGITSLLVSVGGNVCAVGSQDGAGKPWTVGVQNPMDPDSTDYLRLMGLTDQTLVTSGFYQRYYTVAGNTYHHIIDPDTLMPADYFAAVTVLSDDSGVADAMSTALFNLSLEDGRALLAQLPGTEALWVMKDGESQSTAGFAG